MSSSFDANNDSGGGNRHFTTRRGFIGSLGFGVVSLYGVWAAYGAAPVGVFLPGGADQGPEITPEAAAAGHGSEGGMAVDEFERTFDAFLEANSLPDGTVVPGLAGAAPHNEAAGGQGGLVQAPHAVDGRAPGLHLAAAEPVETYLKCFRWGYEPETMRLQRGVPYRFRMMAIDASHGASIRFGGASHIVRLPANTLTEQTYTFSRSGDYVVYCTVYCGQAHDRMKARLIVV